VRARFLVLSLAALALAGCASTPSTSSGESPDIDGDWVLVSGADAGGDFPVDGAPVTLVVADGLVSGTGPCNSFTGSVDTSGEFPRFSAIASTKMACTDDSVMDLEQRFFAALEAVDDGDATDDGLTLSGADDVSLVFAEWYGEIEEGGEMDGEWQFTGGSDAEGDIVVNGVPVTLVLSQGAVSGQAPCNTYTGGVSDNDGTLYFSPIAQTLIGCDEPLTTLETRYLAALQTSDAAAVAGEQLTLSGPGTTLQFTLLPMQSVD
jgi:heat shock protein HslJ